MRHVAARFAALIGWPEQQGDIRMLKSELLFACTAAMLIAPAGAFAGSGVPGGVVYGFNRGSEIAGPVLGGIPGAVVGGVTGGVEGVLGVEHRPQYVAAREEYRPIRPAPHVVHRHHRHHHRY